MSTTTAKKPNLFASTAKKVEKAPAAKKEKPVITIPDNFLQMHHEELGIPYNPEKSVSKMIKRYEELDTRQTDTATEMDTLGQELRMIGKHYWLKEFVEKKVRPENFVMAGEKGGKVMFLVMDKYITIPMTKEGDVTADMLKMTFGDEVIVTSEQYKFDLKLLEKYQEALHEAIFIELKPKSPPPFSKMTRDNKYFIVDADGNRVSAFANEEDADFFCEAANKAFQLTIIPQEDKEALIQLEQKHSVAKGSVERYMQYDENLRDQFLEIIQPQMQLKNAK